MTLFIFNYFFTFCFTVLPYKVFIETNHGKSIVLERTMQVLQ